MARKSNMIISASRRTDLIAWYPEILREKLEDIGHERIHTLVIWTKNPANMLRHAPLRQALTSLDQIFCHLTVTGLGGTEMEPGVPTPKEVLTDLNELIELVDGPERVRWRFDPIVRWKSDGEIRDNIGLFDELADIFRASGVRNCTTSICSLYPKVLQRFENEGNLTPIVIRGAERNIVINGMELKAVEKGISLQWCCEESRPSSGCIDAGLLTRLHPSGKPAVMKRAKGQRKFCGCFTSWDIGWYNQPCSGRCKYCYANPTKGKGFTTGEKTGC